MKSVSPILAALLLTISSATALAQTATPAQGTQPETSQPSSVVASASPAATPAPEAQAAPVAQVNVGDKTLAVGSSWNNGHASKPDANLWQLKLYGYLRTGYTYQQGETDAQKHGFFTANARIGLSGTVYKMFGFNILFDGAGKVVTKTSLTKDKNNNITDVSNTLTYGVTLKDAYLTFTPYKFIGLKVGQFIPEFDYEGMASTSTRPFVNLSQGYAYSKGSREGGISIGASKFQPFDESSKMHDLGFTYLFAISNGTGAIQKTYDFGYTLRVGANWGKLVDFGLGYYYAANAVLPTQGFAIDLQSHFANIHFITSYVLHSLELKQTNGVFNEQSHAFLVSLQYDITQLGLTPGIRYSFKDPTIDNSANAPAKAKEDQTHELTLGLNWEYKTLPIKVVANYTMNFEQGAQVKNNQVDLLFQAKF